MNGLPIAVDVPAAPADQPAERLKYLFDAHHDRLYRLARRLVSSRDDALDLVQETFLRAARVIRTIPPGASAEEAWLVRVLVNIRRDQWRKSGIRSRHERSTYPNDFTSVSQNPEAAIIARTTVWRALDQLSPRRRAIVVMAELDGLTDSAIASLLGISTITVRWHLSKGRRELTRALKPFMGDSNESIKQLLQDADPLQHEQANTDVERMLRAAAIAEASSLNPLVTPMRRGRLIIIAVSALIIGASLIGPRVWPLFVQKSHAAVAFEVRLAEEFPEPGLHEAKVAGSDRTIYLHEEIIITNGDLRRAYVERDPNSLRYGIGLQLTHDAGQRMLLATHGHIGRPVAFLIDNKVVLAPKVTDHISDAVFISGDFTKAEAERIADGIQ